MTKGQKLEALKTLVRLVERDIEYGRASEMLAEQGITDENEQQDMENWLLWSVQDLITGVLQ